MKEFDAIIIGFGKGGKTLAADLAKRGWTVAMIERSDKMYGGTCINIGCIPTKALVYQAKFATGLKDSSFEEKAEFYRQAIAIKEDVTGTLRNKNFHNLADDPNITVYTGTGSFVSPEVVAVQMKNERMELKSKHIFINTGAETVIPAIEGIENNPFVYTSTSIKEVTGLPRELVIVGGGYVGLEFASIYASFGSRVTVLEGFPELIPREDRDIAEEVKKALEKKGIVFRVGAKVQSIVNTGNKASVKFMDTRANVAFSLEADAVLLATGRRPYTTGLNLEAAGVKIDDRGAIIVDEHLRTTQPAIRAIGDVKGGLQFTYISLDDYRIIREDLFGNKERDQNDRLPVSYSVFIDPPLARIGINEDDARKQNLDIIIKKLPVAAIPRVKILGETNGLFKVIIDKKTNKILGCTLFGPEASEVINLVALAMKADLDYTFLRDFIYTHPSMSESMNQLLS